MKKNSVKKNITNTVFQFSLIGFGVGTVIAVVAYIMALKESDLIFTLGNIIKLNIDKPHFLIVTLLPVVFVVVGWIAGKYTYRVAEKLYDLETYKDNSQKNLFNFAEELSKGNLNSEYEPEKGNALGNIMIEIGRRPPFRDSEIKKGGLGAEGPESYHTYKLRAAPKSQSKDSK